MNRSDTFIIAKEGWGYLAGALILFALFGLIDADFLQFLAFGAFVAVGYIYRNPERIVPYNQPGSIVSVADGIVTAIETVSECAGLEGPCFKIGIKSGCLDTSVLRAPFESCVTRAEVRRGSRLALVNPLAAMLNEKALLEFTSENGNSVVCEHFMEQNPADLSVYVSHENRIYQGARYGLMLKGNHTMYLPLESRVAVKVGDKLRAGESLIGYFS